MDKRAKLKLLDESVLDAMINAVESGSPELIPLYSTAIQYLKANETTMEREKDTEADKVRRKVDEANKKRQEKDANRV